ncbi:hypothetical protein Dsin_010633 [Dipteronia sinensis]|uniref:AAA-type ATPase N-terminal domain-containing protein n=1 Tax=Dipteronia sinensis TaxID=43782 RepID=A0AAE0AT61_9ROSI|nr:hypothetical protein Dsin_010633 [Dipteronia sinensis]
MFSIKDVPSTTSVLSAYTVFTATAMLVKTVINEVQSVTNQIIPTKFQDMILSKFGGLCGNGSRMTLTIDEFNGYSINQLYEASEIYLRTKINPSLNSLKVSKSPKENNFSLTINKGEKIVDVFEGVQLLWVMASEKTDEMPLNGKFEKRVIELSFHKKYMEKVVSSYLRTDNLDDMNLVRAARILVSNYLGINDHDLFPDMDELITEVQATPAEIAEELMKSEDTDIALEGLIKFLERKKTESVEGETEIGDNKRKAREEIDVDENVNVVDDHDHDQWKAKKMRILMRDQAGLRQACSPWLCGAEPVGRTL